MYHLFVFRQEAMIELLQKYALKSLDDESDTELSAGSSDSGWESESDAYVSD